VVQIFELKRIEGATALVYHTSEISWLKCISGIRGRTEKASRLLALLGGWTKGAGTPPPASSPELRGEGSCFFLGANLAVFRLVLCLNGPGA